MPRFATDELYQQAMKAVETAAEEAGAGPIARTEALRLALMLLANNAAERWPFDAFWKVVAERPLDMTDAAKFGHHQSITNALNGIRQQIGLPPR